MSARCGFSSKRPSPLSLGGCQQLPCTLSADSSSSSGLFFTSSSFIRSGALSWKGTLGAASILHSFIHSIIQNRLSHWFIWSVTHLPMHSLPHLLACSLAHSVTHTLTPPCTLLLTHESILTCIHTLCWSKPGPAEEQLSPRSLGQVCSVADQVRNLKESWHAIWTQTC